MRIETGESVASDDDVARFAAALGVPVAQLAYAPDPTGMTKRGVG